MENLKIRFATIQDRDFVFNVVNSTQVRTMSFNSKMISYEEHCKWFDTILQSNAFFFIGSIGNVSVGYVRFEWQEPVEEYVLTVAIEDVWRGKGVGLKLVDMCCAEVFKSGIKSVVAFVKCKNLSSIHLFEKSGFQSKGITSYKGREVACFCKHSGVPDKR